MAGARLRVGGKRVRGETGGYYVEPTIFECATPDLTIIKEEIFGGVKQSGFGRDKSLHALEKYTAIKSTWFKL